MGRYFIKSAHIATPHPDGGPCDWEADMLPAQTVHEQDYETFTGLYDHQGQEIHRSERIPMGFARRDQ